MWQNGWKIFFLLYNSVEKFKYFRQRFSGAWSFQTRYISPVRNSDHVRMLEQKFHPFPYSDQQSLLHLRRFVVKTFYCIARKRKPLRGVVGKSAPRNELPFVWLEPFFSSPVTGHLHPLCAAKELPATAKITYRIRTAAIHVLYVYIYME